MDKGQLAAGEHHRNGDVPQHIAEGRGRVSHGIGTVGHHNAVVLLPASGNFPGDDLPLLGLDIGGIQCQNIPAVNVAALQIVQTARNNIGGGQFGGKAVFGNIGGNGAAGG